MDVCLICFTSSPVYVTPDKLYDYTMDDGIYKTATTYEIFYSGQKTHRDDWKLHQASESHFLFKVYHRKKSAMPFTFIGETQNTRILLDGSIHLTIPIEEVDNELVVPSPKIQDFKKYKMAVSKHAHLKNNKWLSLGFTLQKVTVI